MIRIAPSTLAFGLAGLTLLGGCQQAARPRASAAASTACRAEVDRVYAKQNRADLSFRDQRDTPFAAGYLAGNTTQGLGAEYDRDNMYKSCLNNAADPGPAPAGTVSPGATPGANIGGAFTPAAR